MTMMAISLFAAVLFLYKGIALLRLPMEASPEEVKAVAGTEKRFEAMIMGVIALLAGAVFLVISVGCLLDLSSTGT